MLSGVQTRNEIPHDKCKQKRRNFYVQTRRAKVYIYIGVGAMNLYVNEAHTALDIIFCFSVFFNTNILVFMFGQEFHVRDTRTISLELAHLN